MTGEMQTHFTDILQRDYDQKDILYGWNKDNNTMYESQGYR